MRPTVEHNMTHFLYGVVSVNQIYGMTVKTSLVAFIRGEQVFADAKSLSERIKADCDEAMRILGQKELEYEN